MAIKIVKRKALPVIGRVQGMCSCHPPTCGGGC
jgi:Mb-OB3b family methanobactin precursor